MKLTNLKQVEFSRKNQKELCEIVIQRVEEYLHGVVGMDLSDNKEFIPSLCYMLNEYTNGSLCLLYTSPIPRDRTR